MGFKAVSEIIYKSIISVSRTLVKSAYRKTNFLISQPKTYVVGTRKNSLNEMVLLSIQNIW